jgi:hypothetical protein
VPTAVFRHLTCLCIVLQSDPCLSLLTDDGDGGGDGDDDDHDDGDDDDDD